MASHERREDMKTNLCVTDSRTHAVGNWMTL